MSGIPTITVQEARGRVAVPADLDSLAVVVGCSSAGSGLSPFYLSGSAAVTGVGYGDAVDVLTQVIEQVQPDGASKKFPAALYTVPSTTPGSYGTIDTTGVVGTAVAATHLATLPYSTDELYFKVIAGGFIGTTGITFQWSVDGGRNLSRTTALGTATNFLFPNANAQLDFSPGTADLTALNTLLNELKTDYAAHRVLTAGPVHGAADTVDVVTAANASNTATRIALANDLRAQFSAHRILTAGGVHGSADTTNVIVAPVATDDSTALLLALDLKAKYNAHIINVTAAVHANADATNTTTSPAPVAGAFAAGDVVKCRTFAPAPVGADIDAAFIALANSTVDFGLVVCEWPMTAALAAHITTGQSALKARGKRATVICRTRIPTFESSETDAAWNTSIAADFANFSDSTVLIRAAYGLITDALTARQFLRSNLAQFAADAVRVARVKFPDVPADRPMANFTLIDASGNTIGHDEGPRGASTGLSNDTLGNRFSCDMRFADSARREQVFCTVPWVMYAAGEQILNFPTRRIANALEREAVSAGTSDLGADLFYIPASGSTPAKLTAASLAALHGKIFGVLSVDFASDIGNASAGGLDIGLVQINPIVVVTGGNLLTVDVTLAPVVKGYLLNLNVTLQIQE